MTGKDTKRHDIDIRSYSEALVSFRSKNLLDFPLFTDAIKLVDSLVNLNQAGGIVILMQICMWIIFLLCFEMVKHCRLLKQLNILKS